MNRFSSFPVATPGRRADEMTKHSSRSSLVENVSPCLRIVRIHSSRIQVASSFSSLLFSFSLFTYRDNERVQLHRAVIGRFYL